MKKVYNLEAMFGCSQAQCIYSKFGNNCSSFITVKLFNIVLAVVIKHFTFICVEVKDTV